MQYQSLVKSRQWYRTFRDVAATSQDSTPSYSTRLPPMGPRSKLAGRREMLVLSADVHARLNSSECTGDVEETPQMIDGGRQEERSE